MADKTNLNKAIKIAQEMILELMLLNGANHQRYGKVKNTLLNQFTQDVDTYHKITEENVHLYNNHKAMRAT